MKLDVHQTQDTGWYPDSSMYGNGMSHPSFCFAGSHTGRDSLGLSLHFDHVFYYFEGKVLKDIFQG